MGNAVDDDVDALLACLPPRWIERGLLLERPAPRLVDGAGEDPAWVMGISEERVDLEDALAQPRLEMVAHLVEHGVHAVAVHGHRHAVGGVGDADRPPRRETDR